MKEFQIMTSLFSEIETKNNCDAQRPEKYSSCFPDVLICIALQMVCSFFTAGATCFLLRNSSFCGDKQPFFEVQVVIFWEKIKCSSPLETPTLHVV